MSASPIYAEKTLAERRFLLSADNYQKMGMAGFFQGKPKVELLDGIIYLKYVNSQQLLISADDYHWMGRIGVFDNQPKVELIDGKIYTMSPFTPDHNGHVDKISEFFTVKLYGKANIRTQGSIRMNDNTEPEPDITILQYDEHFYTKKAATAADAHLVIEVAVFTLKDDRTIKKKKYAAAGIPEYWIVAPQKGLIEVYKQPEDGNYVQKLTYKIDDNWTFDAFDLAVTGSDFLIP